MLCNTYPPGVKYSKITHASKQIEMCALFSIVPGGPGVFHAKMFVYGNL